jgi:hypothetical protein
MAKVQEEAMRIYDQSGSSWKAGGVMYVNIDVGKGTVDVSPTGKAGGTPFRIPDSYTTFQKSGISAK